MIAISAAEEGVLSSTGGRSVRHRVQVKDAGGTWRDLSTYAGHNLCISASWAEGIDTPGKSFDVTLKREVERLSLAPLVLTSPLNLAFAYPGTPTKLLELAREAKIEVAVTPAGVEPVSGDWKLAVTGFIDEINAADGEHVVLRCSDQQAKLRDTFIERERVYAFAQGANATKGCITWRADEILAVGALCVPTDARKNGHYYRVKTIGSPANTDTAEPTWPTGSGATVTDLGVEWEEAGSTSSTAGTAVETVMQQILNDNGLSSVTLEVPSSPSWQIKAYKCERKSVWDALMQLVDQIGWDLRYKWDGSSAYELTFYAPDRAKVTPDRNFTSSERYRLSRMPTQLAFIRNALQGVYSSTADKDAGGKIPRKTLVVEDATSISTYGRRWAEIAEASTSNIDSEAEMQTLLDNILSDLAQPGTEHECEVPFFRHVELGDLIRWQADGVHYTAAQDLAVVSYRHSVTLTSARTSMVTRGKPSSGFRKWIYKAAPGHEKHSLDLVNNLDAITITATDIIGGTQLKIGSTAPKNNFTGHAEYHVSDTSGFTPDDTTIAAQGALETVEVSNIVPGQTYYALVIPYTYNAGRIVKGSPSEEVEFVAGRGGAGHLHQGPEYGRLPLNGGFETWNDTSTLPDHWFASAGSTWGTSFDRVTGSGGVSGDSWVRFALNNFTAIQMESDAFTVEKGTVYNASWWVNIFDANTAGQFTFAVRWLEHDGTTTVSEVAIDVVDYNEAGMTVGTWYRRGKPMAAPSTARFAKIILKSTSAGDCEIDVDSVRFDPMGDPWKDVGSGGGSFANSWTIVKGATATGTRSENGRGWCKGPMSGGTVGSTAIQLPEFLYPPHTVRCPVVDGAGALQEIEISTGGALKLVAGDNTIVYLDHVSWPLS